MTDFNQRGETRFAPAERASKEHIQTSYHDIKNNPVIRMFQEAMPDLALIVNKQRQLVYANNNLIRFLDIEDPTQPLGKRFGGLIECIHSEDHPSGCGTSEACRFCGIVNSIVQSQTAGTPVVKEARITTVTEGQITSYDLKVKASPLIFHEEEYTIVSISDISDRKRRAILEQSYIHEVMDIASQLNSAVTSIKKEELTGDNLSILQAAEKVNFELMDDLNAQKMLREAEEGTLAVNPVMINSLQMLNEMAQYFENSLFAKDKKIFIDPFSHSVKFISDHDLLKRTMVNLFTNAFEATAVGKTIRTGAKLSDRSVKFWIYNEEIMSDEVKHQIFQRSYSTKSANRGLGTYWARLLVTRYLKGNITFKSDSEGTYFLIEIPTSL